MVDQDQDLKLNDYILTRCVKPAAPIKMGNSFFPRPTIHHVTISADVVKKKKRNRCAGSNRSAFSCVWRMAYATVRHLCLAAKSADSGNSRITRGKFDYDWTLLCNYCSSCFYWNDRRLFWVFSNSVNAIYITVSAVDVSLLFGPLCCRRFPCPGVI